ncbi:MAG: HAMP domain-containing sensor histidine kinase [Oscillospiraceae bacterium]
MKSTDKQLYNIESYLLETLGVTNAKKLAESALNLAKVNKEIMDISLAYSLKDKLIFSSACQNDSRLLCDKMHDKNNLTYCIFKRATSCQNNIKAFVQSEIELFGFEVDTVKSIYIYPLVCNKTTIGMLLLALKTDDVISDKTKEFCELLSDVLIKQLQMVINTEEMNDKLRLAQKDTNDNATVNIAQQEKKIKQLYTMLSHELKTPLNVMLTSLELLRLKLKANHNDLYEKEYNELCGFLEKNIYISLRLTNNLLDAGKMEAKAMDLTLSYVDICNIAQQAMYNMKLLAQAKNIMLIFEDEISSNKMIYCDAEKTERVLLNFLSNAIRSVILAKSNAPFVRLILREDETNIIITVEDNGEGISDAALPHIFDKFYRVKYSNATCNNGSGLGLFISKAMAELQNGTISAESKLGKGSSFTLTLPKNLTPKQHENVMHAVTKHYQSDQELAWAKMEYYNLI